MVPAGNAAVEPQAEAAVPHRAIRGRDRRRDRRLLAQHEPARPEPPGRHQPRPAERRRPRRRGQRARPRAASGGYAAAGDRLQQRGQRVGRDRPGREQREPLLVERDALGQDRRDLRSARRPRGAGPARRLGERRRVACDRAPAGAGGGSAGRRLVGSSAQSSPAARSVARSRPGGNAEQRPHQADRAALHDRRHAGQPRRPAAARPRASAASPPGRRADGRAAGGRSPPPRRPPRARRSARARARAGMPGPGAEPVARAGCARECPGRRAARRSAPPPPPNPAASRDRR